MASRNANIVESPCKKFLQWKTFRNEDGKIEGGSWSFWNKDTEKNENIELPFKFALLSDDCVTFKGYSEKRKQGVWSNEVILPTHEVKIRAKESVLLQFLLKDYKEKKGEIELTGAKYTKSVYIGVINSKKEWEIWNLQLSGSSLSGAVDRDNTSEEEKDHGWFAFTKNHRNKMFSNFIEVNDLQIKKTKVTKFTIPLYTIGDVISPEDNAELSKLTTELDEYHKWYFTKPEETKED